MFRLSRLLQFLYENKFISEIPEYANDVRIEKFSSLAHPTKVSLCWSKKIMPVELLPECAVFICLPEQELRHDYESFVIKTAQPRKAFGEIVSYFAPEPALSGISPRAVVDPTAKLGKGVYIGPQTVIGKDCKIGDGTRIDAGVILYDGITIGKNCHISSGAVIGADGHGYILDENVRYKKVRHMGSVVIGDNVDIGANSCVDRGVLDDTTIGDNTKIDNLVQIAHNVIIGENCMIAASTVFCGSSEIGDNCWMAPGAVLKNGVKICDEVQIGLNSVVYRTVNRPNVSLVGDPAKPLMIYRMK